MRHVGGRRIGGAALLLVCAVGWAQAQTLYHDVQARVIVLNGEEAGRLLTTWAEESGGYYLMRSAERVVLRVPAPRVGELREVLDGVAEAVLSLQPSATDVREEMSTVRSAIRSREEALDLILGYVDQADIAGTLALEQEITGLLREIESLQGRLRRLENDAAYGRIEVTLSSRQQTVPSQRPSSFGWINTVDLYWFLDEALPRGY